MEEIMIWIFKIIYSVLLSTQQNHDETLVNLKLLNINRLMCIIAIIIDYTDKLEVNQMKYTINH